MDTACILRCMGVAFFAASFQAIAGPPEGKGKPAHAGPSPFIHFPVPQRSVGVLRQSQAAAAKAGGLAEKMRGDIPRWSGRSAGRGDAFGKGAGSALVVFQSTTGVVDVEAAKPPEPVLPATGPGFPLVEKEAPLPECGGR
jgi:hypothetical protein